MKVSPDAARIVDFRAGTDPLVISAMRKAIRHRGPKPNRLEQHALDLWLAERLPLVVEALLNDDMTRGRAGHVRHYEEVG